MTSSHLRIHDFVQDISWNAVPERVKRHVAWLTLDYATVSLAGRVVPGAQIAADYASSAHAGSEATALFDGRRMAAPGAAFANGVLANALDFDDGHRLTKGHPGGMVISAALAAAESRDRSCEEFLLAILIGYEVALRAGIELHRRETAYHASAAWGALGVVSTCARLYAMSADTLREALNIAEYHAPIALMSRAVTDPAMTKDGLGWGAFVGMSSALLAEAGFTGLGSEFAAAPEIETLGSEWLVLDTYVKPYPCCRWTQPALDAVLALREQINGSRPERIEIHTFHAASMLSDRRPLSTEDMQYSLIWPVAVALAEGGYGPQEATGGSITPEAARLAESITVVVDPAMNDVFPRRRPSGVVIHTADGRELDSGVVEAAGEPHTAGWEAVIRDKVRAQFASSVGELVNVVPPSLTLGGRTMSELVGALTFGLGNEQIRDGTSRDPA